MMKNILVLCTGNSCRSQIAEGWIRYYAGNEANVFSAGIEAHGLNSYAVKVMKDAVIDISKQKSKTVNDLPDVIYDYIITVCDNANQKCPVFPGKGLRLHKSFPDPASFKGTEEEIIRQFSELRDLIEDFCFDFVHTYIRHLIPDDIENLSNLTE
jgi:arsenate reductase (thioredoxin)